MSRAALLAAQHEVLAQAQSLLAGLDARAYAAPAPAAGLAAAGAHLRHVLDMYGCFLRGLPAGELDYESRARDARIEGERDAGLAALAALRTDLDALDGAVLPAHLRVHGDTPVGHEAQRAWAESTPERELQFLLNHTLHHWALIAAVLRLHGRPVPPEFGMAPSTLRWLAAGEEVRACAR